MTNETADEAFIEAINSYVSFPSDDTRRELDRLCGTHWHNSKEIPFDERMLVRDAIGNAIEGDQWEANGRTYAGAAQRIRPVLRGELGDS